MNFQLYIELLEQEVMRLRRPGATVMRPINVNTDNIVSPEIKEHFDQFVTTANKRFNDILEHQK